VSDDPYLYPGTSVLRNRLGTTDPDYLDKQERALVALRMRRNIPRGAFDLKHLRAIHRHLFQDVYDWAGELRRSRSARVASNSSSASSSRTGMADVHNRLERSRFLKGRTRRGLRRAGGRHRRRHCWVAHDLVRKPVTTFRDHAATTSTPSARGTDEPSSSTSSSSPRRPGTPSTSRGSRARTGSRPRFRATPPTTRPWRQSSPGP
jgi:hypothetical protein